MNQQWRAGRELSIDAVRKGSFLQRNLIEPPGKDLVSRFVQQDHEIQPELPERHRKKIGFYKLRILPQHVLVGVIPGGVVGGRAVERGKLVIQRAGRSIEVLAREIFLDVGKSAHEHNSSERVQASNQCEDDRENYKQGLAAQRGGEAKFGSLKGAHSLPLLEYTLAQRRSPPGCPTRTRFQAPILPATIAGGGG